MHAVRARGYRDDVQSADDREGGKLGERFHILRVVARVAVRRAVVRGDVSGIVPLLNGQKNVSGTYVFHGSRLVVLSQGEPSARIFRNLYEIHAGDRAANILLFTHM